MRPTLRQKSFVALSAAQFLGALNDNAYRQFILLAAVNLTLFGVAGESVAMALFTLPFIFFSLTAGSVADRISKQRVIVAMKRLEILVMALGTGAFALGLIDFRVGLICAMIVLFLMGAQSAFFGPSKYGIIPELISEHKLTLANGVINLLTQVAIVGGVIVAGELNRYLVQNELDKYLGGVVFISIAIIGWLCSRGIQKLEPADPSREVETNVLAVPRFAWREFQFLSRDRELMAAAVAHSWFFLIGALALLVFNRVGVGVLELEDVGGSYLLAAVGLGIACGSPVAAIFSRRHPELGLVPIAALVMSICFSAVWAFDTGSPEEKFWPIHLLVFTGGFFGGIYVVPLATFLQERPRPEEKGRTLGALALMNFMLIAMSAVVFAIMDAIGLEAGEMMLALGAIMFVGSSTITFVAPIFIHRAILLLVRIFIYRVHAIGSERVPKTGGVLFVCNHLSYADPVLLAAGCPRLPRFLMHRSFMNVPFIGGFARWMRVIPIADTDGPRALVKSLDEAADHIAQGLPACIFAEGSISRTGNLLPFSRGLERIARRANCPIVPVYLDRVWGSLFSFQRGRPFRRWPNRIPYRVTVAFGEPLPPDTSTHIVRSKVQELSADALHERRRRPETLATRFFLRIRRHPRRRCMAESTGRELNRRQVLTAVLLLRKLLAPRVANQEYVGLLLPSGIGGALANVALTTLGKVTVNLNFTAGKEAFESSKEQCGLETIITSPRLIEKLQLDDDPRHVFIEDIFGKATRGEKIRAYLTSFLPGSILRRLPGVPTDPDRVATVIFSSGSTGDPKGVCLSHHNILSNTRSITQVLDLDSKDCVVGILPFFHSFGFTATIWLPLLHDFAVAYHSNPTDAKPIAKLIREHGCTILISTPTFFQSYLRRFTKEDVASLRFLGSGAEKLKGSLLEQWREKFGMDIHEAYGCTELSPGVSMNRPDIERGDIHQVGHKPGTIGHPFPGVAIKVIDVDSGEERGTDEEGMLLVKGPATMVGYLGREDLTDEVFRGEWYVTGDIAKVDADGFITITGRLSRFSKIGGEMVPHVRVEEVLQQIVDQHQSECPADRGPECMEVAVTSVPCPERGEKLVVLHTPLTFSLDEVHTAIQSSELPRLWVPRKKDFFEVPELPKLGSGKLDLKAIERIAAESCEDAS